MTNRDRLEALLQQVEIRFNRGSSSSWKNRDFEDLNFEIYKSTKVTISALTLKRIFGKIKTSDDYFPQKATQKALQHYAGTETTRSNSSTKKETIVETQPLSTSQKVYPLKKHSSKMGRLGIALSLVGVLLFFLFVKPIIWDNQLPGNGVITLLTTEGFNPKTAQFSYTTPNDRDSFGISFDESYKNVYVPNGKSQRASYYFQYPGLYWVKMMHNERVVSDTIPIYVATKGWQALGYYFDQKYTERYFPINITRCTKSGIFHPTKRDLYCSGMDTGKIAVVRFDNFTPTKASGDDFTIDTQLKNPDEWSGIRCNSIYLYVVGRLGVIRLRFTNPGCSYWIDYQLSEKMIQNKNSDMSGFTFDLSNWQNLRIENRNKQVQLFVNNKQRFVDSYTKSIGEIVGVTILFHGNGYIKSYQLTDKNQQPIFTF